MAASKIITAADRTAAPRGAKVLIVGPTGVGKTTLLRGVDHGSTLFIDIEAGDLSVSDLTVDTFRPRTWAECRDLAVVLAGPNPAVPADNVYSASHYAVPSKITSATRQTSNSTRPSSSTRSPPPAGCASHGQASSPRPSASAAAKRICAAPMACMPARRWRS
jgi:energy-coupling factor transporter ATP-binding protein EcfA2